MDLIHTKHEMMLYNVVYKPIKQNPFHFLTISWFQLFLGIFFGESSLHILKDRLRWVGGEGEGEGKWKPKLSRLVCTLDRPKPIFEKANECSPSNTSSLTLINSWKQRVATPLPEYDDKKKTPMSIDLKRKPTSQRGH